MIDLTQLHASVHQLLKWNTQF